MKISSRDEVIKILDDLYFKVGAKLLNTKGQYAWPFYRVQIGYILYFILGEKLNEDSANVKLSFKSTRYKIIDFCRLIKQLKKIIFLKAKYKYFMKNKVLLMGYSDHYYRAKEKDVNSYLSPFKNELEKKNISYEELLFFHDSTSKKETELYHFYSVIYEYEKNKFLFKSLFNKTNENAFKNAVLVDDYLKDKTFQQHGYISQKIYISQIDFEIKYNAFVQFLKIISPKLIWTYCYYDNSIMALIKATNYLKIDNVEYQHSIQPDEHFGYAKWHNIDSYSDFFPNKFWVWQQSDKDRILKNFSGINFQPKPIYGGNLFSIQEKEISSTMPQEQKNGVLITLQGEWIPNYLETIVKEDDKYLWYFRLHPRYPGDKIQLLKFKKDYSAKIEIQEANNLTVYELFRKVRFHITAASGVALESKGFGIKNIITGEFGLSAYKVEIESGLFSYCTDKDTMSKLLYSKTESVENVNVEVVAERKIIDYELNKLLFSEENYL